MDKNQIKFKDEKFQTRNEIADVGYETSGSDNGGENRTIPNYKNLKLTLKGKDGYLFLVNDSNKEINQHFDNSHKSVFDKDKFLKNFNSKKVFCSERNIKYFFFIVPDKV